MLNLPGLKVVNVALRQGDYLLDVVIDQVPPECDCTTPNVVSNGRKPATYIDTPMHGKRVEILVKRQRYLCRGCGRSQAADLQHMHSKHRLTQRCYEYIVANGAKRTWRALGDELGIDPQTVSDIWNAWADAELAKVTPATPDWMGIDELFIMGKYRAVITNVREKALVTMLPSRDLGTLQLYFTERFDASRIQVVTMDMWHPYRLAVKSCFPKAKIVVDRFHVMQHASKAVETVRKVLRSQQDRKHRISILGDRWLMLTAQENLSAIQKVRLDSVLEQYPTLKEAYALKEAFRDVWQTTDRATAEAAYDVWKMRVDGSAGAAAWRPLLSAFDNWHTEIFAYMDWRLTNAYTESFNALARKMDRGGNGYSFEGLKKRLLMRHGLQFREDPKVAFNFPWPPGPPKDIGAVVRRLYPVAERPLIGYRLSTLAKVAGKLPKN
jgi:transposase